MSTLIGMLAVLAGALVQSAGGMGLAVVSLPVLAVTMPNRVPQVLILLSMPMLIWMITSEPGRLDRPELASIIGGRVVGTIPGTAIVALATPRQLNFAFAGMSVLAMMAIAGSGRRDASAVSRGTSFVGGIASGVMGTAAAQGGPPLAFLYAGRDGPEVRSNLAVVFLIGNIMSLTGLGIAGRLSVEDLKTALVLLAPLLIGIALGRRLRRYADPRTITRVLLGVVAIGTIALVIAGIADS